MSQFGNKFGAFKGVFTPSILTILGVIMYLRLPWIVGQAGLWATLGIILVAHIISATTGLSVASIATDKKVETGGTYYMISRSLGLPIGGTLGLALFVGLSFSVSLYIIGFSETMLTALGMEVTLNTIRIAGVITLLVVTIITFISTNLALKTQFVILAVLILSLVSIFLGKHDLTPTTPLSGSATNSLPWIALFAIFFPAVTGFEAGVSMSGDLENPKKSIPRGTILAIVTGLIVYLGLAFFFSFTVERDALINDSAVLLNISLYSPLVLAGIWGATLSSAFGSILGAPRILQATAIDRITPKLFAKGVGAGNEPRNALILTFFIALVGILIGELNVIARVVSIFFIITYGFLNLTYAIENWAGSDFRPSFRIPGWISIIGAIACFVVMIQLDFAAMIGATAILGAVFLLLKRRELKLQSGDTWGGFWSSLVKYGLLKLSSSKRNQRNWRPNIILFSGNPKARPHLIDMARILVGKQGVFTNFDLIEEKKEDVIISKPTSGEIEIDHAGKSVITRKHYCKDIYDGIATISRVYGFTGFEPNTILMGWGKRTLNPEKFLKTTLALSKLDYNLVFLNNKQLKNTDNKEKRIDLWWNGNGRNLNFGIALLKYITTDNNWRTAKLRVLVTNYNSAKTDSIYALVNQVLDNSRLIGSVKVINNATEKLSEVEIVKNESSTSDLTILELGLPNDGNQEDWTSKINQISDLPCSTLIIEAASGFEEIDAHTSIEKQKQLSEEEHKPNTSILERVVFPSKEIVAEATKSSAIAHESFQRNFIETSIQATETSLLNYHNEISAIVGKLFNSIEKHTKDTDTSSITNTLSKTLTDLTFQTKIKLASLNDQHLKKIYTQINESLKLFLDSIGKNINEQQESLIVKFFKDEYKIRAKDSAAIKLFKTRSKIKGKLLGWPLNQKLAVKDAANVFLQQSRIEPIHEFYQDFGLSTFKFLNSIRRLLVDLDKEIELLNSKNNVAELTLKIQEIKNQTKELFSLSIEEFKAQIKSAIFNLNADLEQNTQRLCFVVGKPELSYLLYPYQKIIKRKKISMNDLVKMPEIWHLNMNLFNNKCLFEFTLLSLKHRLNIKLHRQVDEIVRWSNSKLLETTKSLTTTLNQIKSNSTIPDTSGLVEKISSLRKSALQEKFELFFKDIYDITQDLPERLEVNGEDFFTEIENGRFSETTTKTIEFRKIAQFYIGTELINNSRSAMEQVSESLEQTATELGDKLRLATFNIEKLSQENDGALDSTQNELKEKLINNLLKDITSDEKRIAKRIEKFENEIDQYLKNAILPLNNLIYERAGDELIGKIKKRKRNASTRFIERQVLSIKSFVNSKLVSILYSRSEGIMLAQKLSAFEKEHKISNQSIQEILVSLRGNKEVIKSIPFYYASLFSGSTTLSKDLWISRPKEETEVKAIVSRYKEGYSGALLITGERNSGKSTLSKYIAKTHLPNHDINVIQPTKGGSSSIQEFYNALMKSFKIETDPITFLSSSLTNRVLIINDLELWWERSERGHEVIMEILSLIGRFSGKIFFIINCGSMAYRLINKLTRFDTEIMGHIECEPFDAKELKELVLNRHKIGGLRLLINGKNEKSLTEWNYAQLFNRHFNLSNGNPGYTLQSWLANITRVTGKSIQIKLPTIPSHNHFDGVSDELWMVILQLILHRRTSSERLARILRQPIEQVIILVNEMQRAGLVEERFNDAYCISSVLEPHLIEKLKEKEFC